MLASALLTPSNPDPRLRTSHLCPSVAGPSLPHPFHWPCPLSGPHSPTSEGSEEGGTSPHPPRLSFSGATRPLFQITPTPGRSPLFRAACPGSAAQTSYSLQDHGAGDGPFWEVDGHRGLQHQDTGWSGLRQVFIGLQRTLRVPESFHQAPSP